MKQSRGFTIIELCLVVVILCGLAALVGFGYNGVQSKNRNGERQRDIDAIKGQLESYYAQTNMYPVAPTLSDAKWRAENLSKLKDDMVQDPRWDPSIQACTADGKVILATQPTTDCYSYQVTAADGSPCDNGNTPCAHYTLTASLEGGEQYVKASLN